MGHVAVFPSFHSGATEGLTGFMLPPMQSIVLTHVAFLFFRIGIIMWQDYARIQVKLPTFTLTLLVENFTHDDQCLRDFLLVLLFIQCLVVVSWIAGFPISSLADVGHHFRVERSFRRKKRVRRFDFPLNRR